MSCLRKGRLSGAITGRDPATTAALGVAALTGSPPDRGCPVRGPQARAPPEPIPMAAQLASFVLRLPSTLEDLDAGYRSRGIGRALRYGGSGGGMAPTFNGHRIMSLHGLQDGFAQVDHGG